jgi:hypothetical protein
VVLLLFRGKIDISHLIFVLHHEPVRGVVGYVRYSGNIVGGSEGPRYSSLVPPPETLPPLFPFSLSWCGGTQSKRAGQVAVGGKEQVAVGGKEQGIDEDPTLALTSQTQARRR